jgi:hypothetical protein
VCEEGGEDNCMVRKEAKRRMCVRREAKKRVCEEGG